MPKMFFTEPVVRGGLVPDPTNPVIVVPGSGQTGLDPFACGYQDWLTGFGSDIDGSGTIDFEDYKAWWQQCMANDPQTFCQTVWEQYNPTTPWPFGN